MSGSPSSTASAVRGAVAPVALSTKLCRPLLRCADACIYVRVFLSKKFPLPAFPLKDPFSTITSPREITVSVAPWTTRPSYGAVSYTHLRAHETRHDLVCRLL